jgi:hypothetical protein
VKSITEIYNDIRSRFYNKTRLDIEKGTVVDSYLLSTSEGLNAAYQEIENNKNPHLFTNLNGDDIDSMGVLVGCQRDPNEGDQNFKYRMINWSFVNESSNRTAINAALLNLQYSSIAIYVPYTEGVGTATVYIIPTSYDGDIPQKAITEVNSKLEKVVSPSAHIHYLIPTTRSVRFAIYISSELGDMEYIKSNLEKKISDYVNSIAPGDYLNLGAINKMGIEEPSVDYFQVAQFIVDDKETGAIKLLQKIESKFLYSGITWWTGVR